MNVYGVIRYIDNGLSKYQFNYHNPQTKRNQKLSVVSNSLLNDKDIKKAIKTHHGINEQDVKIKQWVLIGIEQIKKVK